MGFHRKPKLSDSLLLSEFHPTKNHPNTAEDFTTGSSKKIWWQCSKGHEWEMPPKARFNQNQGCPYCSGKRPSAENNLSLHPVVNEFHPTKNGNKTPEDFTLGSGKKIWWKCSKHSEHIWEERINRRVHESIGCPFCAGRRPSSTNNLSLHPVAKEFHYERNSPLRPEDFTLKSGKKIWWRCSKDPEHEWESIISNRTNGSRCPYCYGWASSSTNNLSLHPVAKEFHPIKNKPFNSTFFSLHSNKKIWWRCDKGHEWEASVLSRVKNSNGCPYCRGTYSSSENNLSLHPVAKEFHYERNTPLKPEDFTLKSGKKIWWKCEKDHEWKMRIADRTVADQRCPYCSGRYSSQEHNLALYEASKEFHYERNSPLKPEDFTPNSNKKIWWICDKGHEWETKIADRTRTDSKETNCPKCSNNGSSSSEREVLEFIEALNIEHIHRYRIDGVEADVFIPKKNVAIEYNGLYWHSSLFKSKKYHYTKYKHFSDRRIQLIQIWEDEWRDKQDVVKSLLKAKLNLCSDKVYARKCQLVKQKCPEFFDMNHIQGSAYNTETYCLFYEDEIIAAMSFKIRSEGVWELVRYATSKSVIGGASKLLKAFERDHSGVEIVSFADLCVSNGGMYYKLGFKEDKILKPDYKYFFSGKNTRIHKFNFRIERFKSDSSLLFEEGKSESELAKMNNLLKVYDAGKIRFIK